MPTSCASVNPSYCGTHGAGWLNGGHPTTADGIVSRTVCFDYSGDCCQWSNTIRVQNCGPYYVYELLAPPACHLRYCTIATTAECSSYSTINDATRKASYTGSTSCDRSLTKQWYRFTTSSSTYMPTSCGSVTPNYCGTHAVGWLNGAHPSTSEGIVTRTVCYNYSGNCCWRSNTIRVRNCGSYYVYELVPPSDCSFRYCSV